ncbi:MAG: hypothetical protein K2K38_05875, partial [Clostridia bacterium]|nr:hypothetical protein [Clostridia bacterium]
SGVASLEGNLTIIKIIDTFTFYGLDVVLLATLTAITVQICKVTFLKKMKKKLLTFLPFTVGIVFYAIYAALKNWSLSYLLTEYVSVIEHGISVGSVATLLYVLYEQFVRDKSTTSATEGVISTLIEGFVPTDKVESVAKEIAQAIERDVTGNGAARTSAILTENAEGEISERDLTLLSKLIIETLAHVNATKP